MNWYIKQFNELTTYELYQILQERVNVFVVEQECPYHEVDGKDQEAFHIYATKDDSIVAYARLLPAGITYKEASIGRVLVLPNHRKTGLGRDLMNRSIHFLKDELAEKEIKIQAQEYAEHFYASFGFKPISNVYLEDNIPHVDMLCRTDEV